VRIIIFGLPGAGRAAAERISRIYDIPLITVKDHVGLKRLREDAPGRVRQGM